MPLRDTTLIRATLLVALAASPASAQFTAVIEPPKRAAAASASQAAATTPGARTDSAGRTRLSDMRAWVDSAAGVTAPRADSTRAPLTADSASQAPAAPAAPAAPSQPEASDAGMRAPDTATQLPALALAGVAMLGLGAFFLRRTRA